ncbi:MAG: extracellular solute-binding protein, partial [Pseudomonadota bacterium]
MKILFGAVVLGLAASGVAWSAPEPGIAMYGAPALDAGFEHLPYANPDAPKGGTIVFGERGGFDAMNPYILKGRSPYGLRAHVFESLMGRSWDEPFTLYGLLAETIEVGPERDWVEFTLREEAAFSDGTPVTVDDVIWSFETLAEKGLPRYGNAWEKVGEVIRVGDRGVRFTFNTKDNELPLIMGLRPILNPRDWDGRDFAESTLDVPLGTGPYRVGAFEPGRFVEFERNPDYWGKDLPFNKGRHNVDVIRYDYFADGGVIFEAFKAGEISTHREGNPAKWEGEYSFPAIERGEIVKSVIPHNRPAGLQGFVFNTRRELFEDWRVRDALLHAFNFEFVNQTLNGGVYPRRASYFFNSPLAMSSGPAEGAVRALLEPFEDSLLPGALDGYTLPSSNGEARNRTNLRHATRQLEAAGWTVQDGVLRNGAGEAFEFSVMLRGSALEDRTNLWADALRRLGITLTIE